MLLGTKFLKVADVSDGDLIKFVNEGNWVESTKFTYSDGSPKQQLQFEVEIMGGETRILTLNKTNRENLIAVWGRDTKNWVGKQAVILVKEGEVAGTTKRLMRLKAYEE